MAVHVRILPSGHEFPVEGTETVLQAALRAGVALGYGCSSGNCGECKGRVVSGRVAATAHHDYAIGAADRAAGYVLLCCTSALSDLVVEASVAGGAEDIPRKHIVAHVKAKERLTEDWLVLHLQTPRSDRLRFLAGQSVNLRMGEGISGEYPLAGCPCQDRNLQIHVRKTPGEPFSDYVYGPLKSGDPVAVEGPIGNFTLREPVSRPLVFLVCHGGFAPAKSLIEHAMALELAVPMHLYWAADQERDIYLPNLCRSWVDAMDDFHYTPLIAAKGQTPLTAGAELPLLQRMVDSHPGLDAADVYVVGPPSFAAQAGELLRRAGVPSGQLSVYGLA